MSLNRMLQWLLLAATTALLMFLKWLHLGVTHYNVFLLILFGWVMGPGNSCAAKFADSWSAGANRYLLWAIGCKNTLLKSE